MELGVTFPDTAPSSGSRMRPSDGPTKTVIKRDGAPMVLGCSAPDGHGANRTSMRHRLTPSVDLHWRASSTGRSRGPATTTRNSTGRTPVKRYAPTDSLLTVESICPVRTTDQKVGGSSPFGRAKDQGRD